MHVLWMVLQNQGASVADPDEAFGGGQSNWGRQKCFHLLKYQRLPATIVVCHTKEAIFCRSKSGYFCWSNYATFQGITTVWKRFILLIEKTFETGPEQWASFFTSYTDLAYLQNVFKISQGNSNEVTNIIFTTEYLTGRLWARTSVISISFAKVSFSWRPLFPLALYNYKLIHFSSHSSDYHGTRNSQYRRNNSNRNALRNTCRVCTS